MNREDKRHCAIARMVQLIETMWANARLVTIGTIKPKIVGAIMWTSIPKAVLQKLSSKNIIREVNPKKWINCSYRLFQKATKSNKIWTFWIPKMKKTSKWVSMKMRKTKCSKWKNREKMNIQRTVSCIRVTTTSLSAINVWHSMMPPRVFWMSYWIERLSMISCSFLKAIGARSEVSLAIPIVISEICQPTSFPFLSTSCCISSGTSF